MNTTSNSHNQPEYSVSDIAGALKRVIEGSFSHVRVRGEISGFKRAASGHCYLDLKDDKSVLNAVIWKGSAARLSFKVEDGLEVIATGKISTYSGRSNYQLIIESMEPAGIGALMALLEKRKQALAAEGLFDPARKKRLPFMPQRIGVVTSPTGAVIRDILHRLSDRFPTQVLLWPVRVQGEGAAEEIAEAIHGLQQAQPDLIIVARGGGSIEDLWCFNEEIVVRAVAASRIPIISAVGHETDVTLIDYAADMRAPTPTAAAEMATPVRREWLLTLEEWQHRMNSATFQRLNMHQERVAALARSIPAPSQLLEHMAQRFDDWSERLALALPSRMRTAQMALTQLALRLSPASLLQQIDQQSSKTYERAERFDRAILLRLEKAESQLNLPAMLLENLNYRHVLKRGYALVRTKDKRVISTAHAAQKHSVLQLVFADGELSVSTSVHAPKQRSLFEDADGS